jgi:hypothetical protein
MHPLNKYHRRLVGQRKGNRRAFFVWKRHSPESIIKNIDNIMEDERSFRDRTTSCPCYQCRAGRAVRKPDYRQSLDWRSDLDIDIEPTTIIKGERSMEKTTLFLGKQALIFTVKDKADKQLDAYELERDSQNHVLNETDIGDWAPHTVQSLNMLLA